MLDEYESTLRRSKFEKYITTASIDKILSILKLFGIPESLEMPEVTSRGPKDDIYLSLALSGKADCIVTGDKDLLVLHPYEGIDIFTSAEFLDKYRP